jgi:hypothetical protein
MQIELLYNLVIFRDTTTTDALERCMFLLARCPAVREVAIKCSIRTFQDNYTRQGFSRIVRYCQLNVNLLVKVHIPYWSQSDPNFILTGLYLLSTLRADALSGIKVILMPLHFLPPPTDKTLPSNIRLFPKEERFCRRTFEQSCRRNPAVRLPAEQANILEITNRVEAWFKQGL